MRKYNFCLLFLVILTQKILAQNPNFLFNQLTLQHGLSEATVRDMVEDRNGYMWFCTDDGLNKYDGYKFTVYKNNPKDIYSISDNGPRFLFLDSKGNLWITTRKGVNLYDPVMDRFYNFKNTEYKVLQELDKGIEVIEEDSKGHLWLAGSEGLYELSSIYEKIGYYSLAPLLAPPTFVSLKKGKGSNLWMGTRDGILLFDIETKKYTDLRDKFGNGFIVNDIFIDRNDNIYFGTTNGLQVYNEKNNKVTQYRHDPHDPCSLKGNIVTAILQYQDGNFLVALDGSGLDYFDITTKKFFHYTHESDCRLNCNNITGAFLDSKGNLWLGTFLNGINYSNPSVDLFHFIANDTYNKNRIKNGIITGFFKDFDNNLWISTDGGGIFVKKNDSETYHTITADSGPAALTNNIALHLAGDSNNLWISCYNGGVNRYNYTTGKIQQYLYDPKDTTSLSTNLSGSVIVHRGKVWINTLGKGIDVLDPVTKKYTRYRHNNKDANTIPSDWMSNYLEDKNGTLWIGSQNGLCKYQAESNNFKTYYFDRKGLAGRNLISEILEDKDGVLWLGTFGGGLIRFETKTEKFKVFTTEDGLTSDNIKIAVKDNFNNLWLATNNGITKFNTVSYHCEMYSVKDGITPNAFCCNSKYKDGNGNIYFGANGGYLIIDPKSALKNNRIPPIVFTGFEVDNKIVRPKVNGIIEKNINYAEKISLHYKHRSISFDFAALNFVNQEKNKYSYYLKGFDKNWSPVSSQRTATYTNLTPGHYTFMVKGSNNDGVWNQKGTSVKVEIEAPFWQMWWCIAIETGFVLFLLYKLYRWRLANIRLKNKELESIIEDRTTELKESNAQLEAFVYKASHDIRGPLKSVIGVTTVGMNDFQDNKEVVTYFEHILKSTKKLDKLLSELLEITKVKQSKLTKTKLKIEELIQEVITIFQHREDFKKMEFRVNIAENFPLYSDKNLLSSVVQNLIENAIKYRDPQQENSTLAIDVLSTEKEIRLTFKDNGLGIPEELKDRIFDMFYKINNASEGTGLGLYIVKTSVEKLNGKITVQSELGKGTTFTVSIIN